VQIEPQLLLEDPGLSYFLSTDQSDEIIEFNGRPVPPEGTEPDANRRDSQVKAAVVRGPGDLRIEEISDPSGPGPGEVLIRMVATGVCHTDLSVLQGQIPLQLPLVLGHEGAGVVESVGDGVTHLSAGDHVVVSIVVSCGSCYQCSIGSPALCEIGSRVALGGTMLDGTGRLHAGDEPLHHIFCQSSFAEYAVVPARSAVPVGKDVPLDKVCVLGCGATTGIGAVIRRARVEAGSSVLVVGCGGVGLSAVMAAKLAGAATIIAADRNPAALERAATLGATHTVDVSSANLVESVHGITTRGADYAIDAVGTPETLQSSFAAVRAGGDVVAVGLSALTNTVTIDMFSLLLQKRLTGTYAGSVSPQTDIPPMVELYRQGRLPLDQLVSESYKLDELSQAFADMEAGRIGRGVVLF
jgi:Zn-dependent alcohol dehydrogenase